MQVFYILSSILLMYLFLKIKKCNKTQNLILWVTIAIVLFMGYNSITIFGLSIFNIKSTLFVRGMLNLIISVFIYYKYIKNKVNQIYTFDWKDLIVVLALIIITIIIGYLRFGKDLSINFETTDPTLHYVNARYFYDTNTLLNKIDISDIYNKSTLNNPYMFVAATNAGTLMQLFDFLFDYNNLYSAFIIFELFIFFISGMLLYVTIKKNHFLKINDIIFLTIVVGIYILGYPLNNLIFGFHYFGVGILLINLCVLLVDIFYNEDIKNQTIMKVIIFISSLSLFFTYYLFIPCIYAAIGLYILYESIFHKKKNIKESIFLIIQVLVIPFIIGMLYFFIIPHFTLTSGELVISNAMNNEGYIYRNLFGNFIFLFPLFIYSIFVKIKQKKLDQYIFSAVSTVLFAILFFILVILGRASTYYFYKFSYVIWLYLYIIIAQNILVKSELKTFLKLYIYAYLIIIMIMACDIENKINNRNNLLNPVQFSTSLTDIYSFNKIKVKNSKPLFTDDELKLLDYIKSNPQLMNKNHEIIVTSNYLQKLWIFSIYDIISMYNFERLRDIYEDDISLKEIQNNKNIKYFGCFYDSDWYVNNKEELHNLKVIYKNNGGIIYSK